MMKKRTNTLFSPIALFLAVTFAGFALPALADDGPQSKPARKSMPKNENGIVITNDKEVVSTNSTVTLATTFMNVPDGFLTATIIAGWAFPHAENKFGSVTVRLDMFDTPNKKASTGRYKLVENLEGADPGEKHAALKLQDTMLKDGPKNVEAISGTVELKSVTFVNSKVKAISLTYDGVFRDVDKKDEQDYKLSGSIVVKDQP